MNDTATALGNQTNSIFSNTSPGVVIVLALVALFAAVTIAGLVYGAHQKRRRVRAEAEVVQHADEEREATGGDTPPDTAAAPPPAAPPPQAEAPEPQPETPAPTPLADEPIAATDAATANPAIEAEASAEPEADVPVDADADVDVEAGADAALADAPVTILKGLGPKVAARLNELGIATIADLAALDDRAAQDLDARLGAFTGRMTRDRWLEQARLLAAGDRKTFEERFGKL